MVYEYEKENISKIDHFNIVAGSNNVSRPSEELEEVYRKAKAFDEIKKILDVYLGNVEDELNALNLIREKLEDMEDE